MDNLLYEVALVVCKDRTFQTQKITAIKFENDTDFFTDEEMGIIKPFRKDSLMQPFILTDNEYCFSYYTKCFFADINKSFEILIKEVSSNINKCKNNELKQSFNKFNK